ncbi:MULTISPECIES: hypothetical protein [unclassified Bradyrhizobium]|uniref:hypothetical protein n=1 Tax=unclassified Bradyrhizobium TaxID=2631580 RepID=UPI002FEFF2B8
MNAVLAKPIRSIWFIQARAVDLYQSLAAALFVGLTSWLRDHPSLPARTELLRRTIKIILRIIQRAAPFPINANAPQGGDKHCGGEEASLRCASMAFACGEQAVIELRRLFWNAQHGWQIDAGTSRKAACGGAGGGTIACATSVSTACAGAAHLPHILQRGQGL